MINVGIIGCGFVGGALKNWLENNNPECKLFISDPYKGYNDDLSNVDIAFLQIHVPRRRPGSGRGYAGKFYDSSFVAVSPFVLETVFCEKLFRTRIQFSGYHIRGDGYIGKLTDQLGCAA